MRRVWIIGLVLCAALQPQAASAWTAAAPAALGAGRGRGPIGKEHTLSSRCAATRARMMPRGTLEMTSRQEAGGAIQGLLFDCDGTLVNSMPMWADNWVETCSEFGLALDHERFYSLAGLTIEETLEALCREQGKQVNAEEFFARKDVLAAHSVELVTEISPVAQVARDGLGVYKMGVVSSGPRAMVEQFLQQTNLRHLFSVLVCAEDVAHHKPHPEPFLAAATLLGVPPENCRAYEDADAGCQAVRAAGMQLVDVRLLEGYPAKPGSPTFRASKSGQTR